MANALRETLTAINLQAEKLKKLLAIRVRSWNDKVENLKVELAAAQHELAVQKIFGICGRLQVYTCSSRQILE
ncbi:6adecd5c-ad9d-4a3e-af74-b6fe0acea3c3 [Sclerotinia trifoliorum]|uniref:6adecd5c-ad9d-4a3e-af74-b6fe0acea3c3 n=1 Tax=Sclerotinia trifoliorum TaxID=28548 RepID=A0A8H2ZT70_9HELO|nr:6adecd5c-ad9d-4a3e-af74-b6fe0acea3c3 [Sclerotinia trifoliorum]